MKILVTGAWKCTQEQLDNIKHLPHSVLFLQNESDDIPCDYGEIEGVICNGLFLHHAIEKFTNLKFIQLTSAGFDRVPMQYIQSRGIAIFNARGIYSIPMAEFVLSGVLDIYKKKDFFANNQKDKKWIKNRSLLELFGKIVCIVGCGSVGTECAKRFKAFGCKVIGVDVFVRLDQNYDEIRDISEIDGCLKQADVVVLTLPLTKETVNLFDEQRLRVMKKGSVLVNISRGKVLDEKALGCALDENLGGAVLDVFEEEPLPSENYLWSKENVMVTPHNSFVGEGNSERLFKVIIENLKNFNEKGL